MGRELALELLPLSAPQKETQPIQGEPLCLEFPPQKTAAAQR